MRDFLLVSVVHHITLHIFVDITLNFEKLGWIFLNCVTNIDQMINLENNLQIDR